MPLDKQELAPGTKLVGTYKKALHVCEVVETPEGDRRYRLEDGTLFKSPSSAAKAVMGGISANGWRFWSLEGDAPASNAKAEKAAKRPKTIKQIKKVPNQKTTPIGKVRWFCSACMAGFLHDAGQVPANCPSGHPAEVEDDFAPRAREPRQATKEGIEE